jgi:hypothetical protein
METREQAIEHLQQCGTCKTWRTDPECDHCWIGAHRCPPTPEQAMAQLRRAIEIGHEAQQIARRLSALFGKP